jgi:L-alanine-DL-glutamate epimerase-like enolase superfamily enzyme
MALALNRRSSMSSVVPSDGPLSMRIAELSALVIELPLRRRIKHASASRDSSRNVLIRCRLADGTEGWGEGVPRTYVTGESAEGALDQLAATPLADQLAADCATWEDVIDLCNRFRPAPSCDDPRDCHGNALRCAVELSVLDAFGQLFGEPLSAVTHHFAAAQSVRSTFKDVRYSTAITAESPRSEALSALKMRLYGFRECKVKVGVTGADDVRRLSTIRRWIGGRMDLRLDANEAWPAHQAAARIEPLLKFDISCIEQPVPHAEVAQLAELRGQLGVPIMLDESLTSLKDAETAIQQGTCDLFNIRLSKCGGFLNSLRLAARAHQAGLGYQLGCHPGESGILSAAGRHWAVSVRDLSYLEGSYDRHLLKESLTYEDFTFGFGGRAPALPGPGLGATVDPITLKRLLLQSRTFGLAG